MTHKQFLITQAHSYWEDGYPLPLDLFYKMVNEGLDVGQLEINFYKEQAEHE